MFENPINLIGTILIISAMTLCALPFTRPKLFRRQDIVLIIAFFFCGLVLFSQHRWYRKELTQLNLILLSIPGVFYTIENIRMRNRTKGSR